MTVGPLLLFVIMFPFVNGNDKIIGAGYNLLNGNPDGINPVSGGTDPGIQFKKILDTDRKLYPNSVMFNRSETCTMSGSVRWFHGKKSYQEKLQESLDTSGDGNYNIRRVAFTHSPQFIYNEDNLFSNDMIVQDITKTCTQGEAKNIMNIIGSEYFPITEAFAAAVCDLSSSYDNDEYQQFLETWGTHVIVAADFGIKKVKRFKSSDMEFFKYLKTKVPESIFPSSADFRKINFLIFQENPYYQKRFGKYTYTLSVGSDENPEPVSMRLVSIDMMLQRKFWRNLDSFVDHNICNENTTLNNIFHKKTLLIKALKGYSQLSKIPTAEDVTVPIIWPRGTYALLMANAEKYGRHNCPSGVQWNIPSVKWCTDNHKNGWRQQSENDMSQSGHFAGRVDTSAISLKFCVKTEIATNRERQVDDWPKGNYCIVKYASCPEGFLYGSILWDTLPKERCNSAGNYPPEGSYGKDVSINFCCRNDSATSSAINLPIDRPFYLIRNNGSDACQQVEGMTAKEEYITWDNDNNMSLYKSDSNIKFALGAHPMVELSETFDITMYFCYYYTY